MRALRVVLAGVVPGLAMAAGAIDADTRAPLPGTWIIATRTVCSGFGHCGEVCVELRSGQDDNVIPWYRATKDYKWFAYRRGYYDVSAEPGHPTLSRKRPWTHSRFRESGR